DAGGPGGAHRGRADSIAGRRDHRAGRRADIPDPADQEPGMTLTTHGLQVAAGGRTLIANLDWQVKRGEFWCVLGQNGVGKSTLLHVLAGLVPAASGQVHIDGKLFSRIRAGELARLRGLLPQQQFDAFSYTALEAVLIGRTPHRVGAGWDSEEDLRLAVAALQRVGLEGKIREDILHLSG